jgi:predicted lipoprotein with Yx(FWY)xxD motif
MLAVSIIRTTIIALVMKAVSTSETSVSIYQTTRRNIPEDSHLRTFYHFHNDHEGNSVFYTVGTVNCFTRLKSGRSVKLATPSGGKVNKG